MKKAPGIVMTACILSAAVLTSTVYAAENMYDTDFRTEYTDDEIERRIDEIGEKCIRFYIDGWNPVYGEPEDTGTASSSPLGKLAELFLMDKAANAAEEKYYAVEETEATAEAFMPAAGAGAYEEYVDIGAQIDALPQDLPWNTEEYTKIDEHGFTAVQAQPFSTFGADIDTASYALLRRGLIERAAETEAEKQGLYAGYYVSPIEESAIRVEEMINYFAYHYAEPESGEKFGVSTTVTKCPWNEDTLLLRIGIKAEDMVKKSEGNNIVFLIDTSGSMDEFDKLPLVKTSMKILADQLDEHDRVSIVTYAGSEEVLLEGAEGKDKDKITRAFDSMKPWGGTYGEGGIEKAYEIASRYFIEGGNNRVVLCTDGDFNLGVSSAAGLEELISGKRETGIFFSCFGFGDGNYSDTRMETLADNGNGNYFYIDCEREARKALEEEFFSTIHTAAKDTKFQVEFNPENVKGYRQIGYENREMAAEDFADDAKDGGEVGAGQTVTVLYEIVPMDSDMEIGVTSKYGDKNKENDDDTETSEKAGDEFADELLTVNIRYKEPDEEESELREYPVLLSDVREKMDEDTSWAAGVAQAGMLMRGSEHAGTSTFDSIYDRLKNDPDIMDNDYKAEFLFMIRLMKEYKAH